jgi:queuosine precursor transporter
MLIVAVAAYAAAIVAANLSVAAFGPAISPVNAFLFIGFDLALRDWLHIRLNPAAGIIAVASTTAFVAAAAVDWGVFAAVKGSWLKRSNTSNVAAAAVDSLVFPTLAFGALMPHIVAMQFVAKVLGGALWTWALNNARK